MQRTKIEWCDFTINPVKGVCPVHCKDNFGNEYCYSAKPKGGLYARFKWNPEIRYDDSVWDGVYSLQLPSKIFVGSTMELFGDWVQEDWLDIILGHCFLLFPQHTFIIPTKWPQNLIKWSPFPPNCWIGVSATNQTMHNEAITCLAGIKASVKFISYEPLLSEIKPLFAYDLSGIQWVIIGSRTQPVRHPEKAWVREILQASEKANIPVFIKEPLASYMGIHRQEFPRLERGNDA